MASGYLQVGYADAVVVLSNVDAGQAVLNVTLSGAKGVIDTPDLIDVTIEPGASVEIPLHTYAAGQAPIGVRWQSTLGRVVAWVRSPSPAVDLVAPTTGDEEVAIPAIPADASKVQVQLTNPATVRVSAHIDAVTSDGSVPVVGGEDVTVEAGSTLSLDLTSSLRGEAKALLVHAEQPVAASAVVTVGKDLATVPGVPASALAAHDMVGVVEGPAVLMLANTAAADAQVSVTTLTAAGESTDQSVSVPAGTSVSVPVSKGVRSVRVHGVQGLAAALIIQPGGDAANGTSVVDLPADTAWSGMTPVWAQAQPGW
jgi:hypothetical protein